MCCIYIFLVELHFLIQWLEDEDEPLYDVVPARDIRVPEGSEVVNLAPGDKCGATFDNNLYNAEVVATGMLHCNI